MRELALEELARLPEQVRKEVHAWLDRFAGAPDRGVGPWLQGLARDLGLPAGSVRNKFYRYKRQGARALVDRRHCSGLWETREPTGLPRAFIEHWQGLCERFQRSSAAAHRALLRQLHDWRLGSGEAIPGYRRPPENAPAQDHPRGWSRSNLMNHLPAAFCLTAARRGRSAAAVHRPLVFTTRVGLHPGQFLVFDDVWHDLKCNVLGSGQRAARRPLELACLDIFSGAKVAWGFKPVLEHEASGAMEQLKERDMRFLFAHVLCNVGYYREGCTLMVEHGTAAIRPELERRLGELSQGRVRVSRSGIAGKAAFVGQYRGRPRGNSRFKAALESHHNLVHNELANLPGQVGKGGYCPEELSQGRRYLTFGNPYRPDRLLVCDDRMRFLGVCRAWGKVQRGDDRALAAAMGRAQREETELLAPLARRGRGLIRERMRDAAQNAGVLRKAGVRLGQAGVNGVEGAPERPRPRKGEVDQGEVLAELAGAMAGSGQLDGGWEASPEESGLRDFF